jgi:hypothetical protein
MTVAFDRHIEIAIAPSSTPANNNLVGNAIRMLWSPQFSVARQAPANT